MFQQFREYLITNIIYINMLDNVFNSVEIFNYIFSIDYIYNFLQIKLNWNESKLKEEKLKDISYKSIYSKCNEKNENENENEKNNYINTNNSFKPLFLQDDFQEIFTTEENSLPLIKLGIDFKRKKKLESINKNKHQEYLSVYNKNNTFSCYESFNYNSNSNSEKSFNYNSNYSNKNHKTKRGSIENKSFHYELKENHNISNITNNNLNKKPRKNTYTFGQGLKKYCYNNEQSKVILNENENEKTIDETKSRSRSNSYERLGNIKTNCNYNFKLNKNIEDIKGNSF
jgi:hypothetical protein